MCASAHLNVLPSGPDDQDLDCNQHCGWTLPHHSLALINVPFSPAFNLFFFFHDLCSTLQKLRRSNWCYCETKQWERRSDPSPLSFENKQKCVCPAWLFPTKRRGKQPPKKTAKKKWRLKEKQTKKNKHSCWMWVLSAFSKSGNCNYCVCFCFFSCRQSSYDKLILHLPTLQLSVEMAQTKTQKSSNKEEIQTTTNVGVDVRTLSSSNKQ